MISEKVYIFRDLIILLFLIFYLGWYSVSDFFKFGESLTLLDDKAKVYQRVCYEETENKIEDEVDILMSRDIFKYSLLNL